MRRYSRLLWFLTIIYWCGIFYLTHLPGPKLPLVPLQDKTQHFLAYGALGGLLYLSLWSISPTRRDLVFWVLVIGMAYGAIDEWTQALPIFHRYCEFADWCADCAGLSTAAVGMTVIRRLFTRTPPDPEPHGFEVLFQTKIPDSPR